MNRLTPALAILACCLPQLLTGIPVTLLPHPAPIIGPDIRAALLFHFTHANLLHLAANAAAIIYFRPRTATAVIAYAVASVVALIYIISPTSHLPACGLSCLICAAFARRYAAHRLSPLPFLLIQLPIPLLLPNFSLLLHMLSFLLAYIIWKIYYSKTTGPLKNCSKKTSEGKTTFS